MTGRETAHRVLLQELSASGLEEKGEGERAASYVLSPLGIRMNRVLVVGRLSPAQAAGRDPTLPFLRARLDDPTGTLSVTAGSFQPRALEELRRIATPTFCLVVGKAHLYRGRDGRSTTSVRAEYLRPVDAEEGRQFLAEAALATLDRIAAREGSAERSSAAPHGAAPPPRDLDAFREAVERCRAFLEGAPLADPSTASASPAEAEPPTLPPVTVTRLPPPSAPKPPSAAERAEESAVLDLVDELAETALDGYADLKELTGRAARRGVSAARAEAIVNRLEETGALEEPVVGKLRRA